MWHAIYPFHIRKDASTIGDAQSLFLLAYQWVIIKHSVSVILSFVYTNNEHGTPNNLRRKTKLTKLTQPTKLTKPTKLAKPKNTPPHT